MAALPRHFSPLYVATIKAAERTGNVAEALGRYIAYQEELERVRKKIVSASIYPAILIAVGSLVLAFLMFYVVPRFARVYEDMAGTLPFFSKLLLAFGSFVGNNALVLGALSSVSRRFAVWLLSKPEVRAWLNTQLWRVPALGRAHEGLPARAPVPHHGDAAARRNSRRCARSTWCATCSRRTCVLSWLWREKESREGVAMSAALGAVGLATPVAARMMVVGERSGDMGQHARADRALPR